MLRSCVIRSAYARPCIQDELRRRQQVTLISSHGMAKYITKVRKKSIFRGNTFYRVVNEIQYKTQFEYSLSKFCKAINLNVSLEFTNIILKYKIKWKLKNQRSKKIKQFLSTNLSKTTGGSVNAR